MNKENLMCEKKIITTMYSIMYGFVHILNALLYMNEMNDSNYIRDKRIKLFCYYKLLIVPVKQYSGI